MNTLACKPLSLLILCLIFSNDSFSHWGTWGNPTAQGSLVVCKHNDDPHSKYELTKAELNTRGPLSNSKRLELKMWLTPTSKKSIMRPQIIKSSDRIKKEKPHFPIETVKTKQKYIEKNQTAAHRTPNSDTFDGMGYQPNESGLVWSCRITDVL
ncbi:MAG: hypothetical protein K6L75_04325 [Cellvibrionaceae bacterium]